MKLTNELEDQLSNNSKQAVHNSTNTEGTTAGVKRSQELDLEGLNSSTSSNSSFHADSSQDYLENLERLILLQSDLESSVDELKPVIEFLEHVEYIEKNYNNITALVKEAPLIDEILLKLHNYICGNETSLTLDMILGGRQSSSYLERIREFKTLTQYYYDPKSSPECNQLYKTLESTPSLKLFWHFLKPFARGKIVFSPNTPIVKRIIQRVKEMMSPPLIPRYYLDKNVFPNEVLDGVTKNLEKIKKLVKLNQKLYIARGSKETAKPVIVNSIGNTISKVDLIVSRLHEVTKNFSSSQFFPLKENHYNLSKILECYTAGELEGFDTEDEASNRSLELCEKNALIAQISFLNSDNETLKPFTTYKIRMNADRVPIWYFAEKSGPNYHPYYDLKFITFGFIYIQDIVEKIIISELTGRNDTPGIILKQMPYPCYIEDRFMSSLSDMFPLFMMMSWIYTCAMIVRSIVYEKELRLKETLRVLGLSNEMLWLGWFIDNIIPMFLTSCLLSLVLVYGNVLGNADLSLVIIYITAYALATISLSFLISVFFSKANIAALSAGVIFFLGYLPFPFMEFWYSYFDSPRKIATCLLSNVAFGLGSKYFAMRELEGTGAHWSNIAQSPIEDDDFNILIVILMLLLDSVIYFVLCWYIEGVYPGDFGIPKPWNFPFMKSYWFTQSQKKVERELPKYEFIIHNEANNFEEEPSNLPIGVVIRNLTKVYKNGKVAVKDLNMNFYENQISSFLGKNGAGKTTTISILTGLFPPTSGSVLVYGLDMLTEMDAIRRIVGLGICPQHNILFDDLTVQEHLWFFARLKGRSAGDVQVEMQQMIEDLGLVNKRHCRAKHLSGGMKRKLSIAIAFIGGSRFVILDEPTAGVDTYSRLGIWKLLLKYKTGRTVITTTHIMSEAELIGDRIAIFASGKLLCCGSSTFLKSRFGRGYLLTVDKKATLQVVDEEITNTVCSLVPGAYLVENFGTELKYSLPMIGSNLDKYTDLFTVLGSKKHELGIRSFGITDSSLEEIFLRLTDEYDQNEEKCNVDAYHPDQDGVNFQEKLKVQKGKNLKNQFIALHIKRFNHISRNKTALLTELVLPALLVLLSMWVTNSIPPVEQPKPIEIDVTNCSDCLSFFESEPNMSYWSERYIAEFNSTVGLGIKCATLNEMSNAQCQQPSIKYNRIKQQTYLQENCSCDSGNYVCPSVYENIQSRIKMSSGYEMLNVTTENVSDWIVRTWHLYYSRRSGGYSFGTVLPLKNINLTELITRKQNDPHYSEDKIHHSGDNIKVWFNNRWLLSPVAHLNSVNNIILRASMPKNVSDHYGIKLINHPMNFTSAQYQTKVLMKTATALLHSISIIIAMSFVPASFIMYLIEERASGSKHLQFISGVNWALYWIEAFVWDIMCYLFSAMLCALVFLIFNEEAYISKGNLFCFITLLVLYGWASIPFMYPSSFYFTVPSSAFVRISYINIFIGITTTASTYMLRIFNDEGLINVEKVLRDVFRIFPHFCLGESIMKMAENFLLAASLAAYDVDATVNNLAWDSLGKNMLSMFITGIFFFGIVLVYERYHYREMCAEQMVSMDLPKHEDDDVEEEKERVLNGPCDDVLVVKYLSKVYKGSETPAVNQLCLGIKQGECFGLLGLNGAGKTTTFKMLTGDTSITFGDALVLGKSIRDNLISVRTSIGYCPQFDALDPKLTPLEHLQFYAQIRNTPRSHMKKVASDMLKKFDLYQYRNIRSSFLSGGNRRKLSAAIAMVGNPQLIFLDEPTCGMDPKSQRFLWDRIRKCVKQGRSVILTTHSMRECEALCSRLTIMVNGQFRCLGSTQHLKNKYGHGYNLVLRAPENNTEAVRTFLKNEIPKAVEISVQCTQMRYNIDVDESILSKVLTALERAKNENLIQDYSLFQKSMDEVFLQFVQMQNNSPDQDIVLCRCVRPCIKLPKGKKNYSR